jgi:hypothetical protein
MFETQELNGDDDDDEFLMYVSFYDYAEFYELSEPVASPLVIQVFLPFPTRPPTCEQHPFPRATYTLDS